MFIKSSIAAASVLLASVAFAQAPLGSVTNVNGLVTVTDGRTGGTVAVGSPVRGGMRFVTTSSGGLTLRLNNGCVLTLQPNQAVTVIDRMTCPELLAAVQSTGASTAGNGGGSFGKGLLASGSLVASGFAIHKTLDRNPSLSTR